MRAVNLCRPEGRIVSDKLAACRASLQNTATTCPIPVNQSLAAMALHLLHFLPMEPKLPYSRTAKWEKILAGDYIPLFGGRPLRAVNISKDDVLNLRIVLNTTGSVEEFLG